MECTYIKSTYGGITNEVCHKGEGGDEHEGTSHSHHYGSNVHHPDFVITNEIQKYTRSKGNDQTREIGFLKQNCSGILQR